MANISRACHFNTVRGCYLHAENYNAKHHMDHSEAGQNLSLGNT